MHVKCQLGVILFEVEISDSESPFSLLLWLKFVCHILKLIPC